MASLIAAQKGTTVKKVATFMDWGGCGNDVGCAVGAMKKTSKLADDMLISRGLKDPLGFYEDGSPELAQIAGCITPTGEVESNLHAHRDEEEALDKTRVAMMCSARVRCLKAVATPFHEAAVYAVNESIKQVDASRATKRSLGKRARFQ
jgi:hypothetical protein